MLEPSIVLRMANAAALALAERMLVVVELMIADDLYTATICGKSASVK